MVLPVQVHPDETLARFIATAGRINKETLRPRVELFMPHPYFELSVFRTTEISHQACRDLGQREFADKLSIPTALVGWTDLKARHIFERKLTLDTSSPPNDPSHERPANVMRWPAFPGDRKMEKALHKEIALELVAAASTVRFASAGANEAAK